MCAPTRKKTKKLYFLCLWTVYYMVKVNNDYNNIFEFLLN